MGLPGLRKASGSPLRPPRPSLFPWVSAGQQWLPVHLIVVGSEQAGGRLWWGLVGPGRR